MPLRLKSLELQGYKTFASRTLFEFASGITAIVGPNGSGKSNIADAMRWVLGEQSYSLLRGKKTEDMIFSGSEHRPRAGMAHASVTFDNSETWLPVDFSEVALARHAFRDGRNDYLLNGQHVRLKDINELLAQSGLSERSYTILGQGLVDASLALKADERRLLFEEAAGVSLYRSRREDALKRLEHTRRNLERVLDIISELEPRLRSLERQAKRAIDYGRAQADLRIILRDWYGYHWHFGQTNLTDAREKVRDQEKRVEEASQSFQKSQADYMQFRERLSALRAELNTWHRHSAELHAEREDVSRELAVAEERRRSLNANHLEIEADFERALDEEKLILIRMAEVDGEREKQQADFDEAQSNLAQAKTALEISQADLVSLTGQLTERRNLLESLTRQKAEHQVRLDDLRSRSASFNLKLEQTQQSVVSAESAVVQSRVVLQKTSADRRSTGDELQALERSLQDKRDELDKLEQKRRSISENVARQESGYSRLKAQLEVLEQSESNLSGYADGARFLLDASRNARLKNTHGAISAVLDVPAELETAITAALGDTLDAIVLDADELEAALHLLETEKAGRAALMPLVKTAGRPIAKPRDEAFLGVASELIKVPENLFAVVEILLGSTLIVKDRFAARRLVQGLPFHARVVTLQGEVFRGDGLVIAGNSQAATILSRPRLKRELNTSLEDAQSRLAALGDEADRQSNQIESIQNEIQQISVKLARSRDGMESLQKLEQQAALDSESASRQLQWHKEQSLALEEQRKQVDADESELTRLLAAVETQSTDLQNQLHQISADLSRLNTDELQTHVTYWTTRAAVIEGGMQNANARRDERSDERTRLESLKSDLTVKLNNVESEQRALDIKQEELRARETSQNLAIEQLQLQIGPAEIELGSAESQEIRLQSAESAAQRSMANAERLLNQLQLEMIRRQENLNTLREKIVDDFGLVEFDYAEDVSGPQPLPFEGLVEQLPVVKELPLDLEQQLMTQKARLRRLGPVNPEARNEFETESERYSFLKTQVDDLNKAEADLNQVISELDELTRRDFVKTFELVDKEFRQSFVRLFGGGSARLSLTDPDNIIETGIEIEARLPGRREQGLALLSGGERSLTAIALVFALLKISPTPVCVLDEVDAMLDEANVGRFRDLLAELSKDTQFVIITHNRNTVQAAEVIYGVTMGRDSTSQVISLRLDEVTDEILTRG
jgi:chromosome segregation protein